MELKTYIDIKNKVNKMDEFNKICRKSGPVIIRSMSDSDFNDLNSYVAGKVKFNDLNLVVRDYVISNSIAKKVRG